MPPKKKRSKSKSKPRATQTQSQKVIVNIGGSSVKRKRRSGGSSMTPASHAQNLVPFFIQAAQTHQPLVDYDRIAKMTGSLQEQNVPNRTPALQTQVPASVMAGAAAERRALPVYEERRAGPTSGGFESTPSESSLEQEPPISVSERVASIEIGKPEPLSRASSSASSSSGTSRPTTMSSSASSVSTLVDVPSGRASVSKIKAMGAAEEQGRVAREAQFKQKQEGAELYLRGKVRKTRIERFDEQLAPMTPASVSIEQRKLLRAEVFRSNIGLGELTSKSQARLRLPREPK